MPIKGNTKNTMQLPERINAFLALGSFLSRFSQSEAQQSEDFQVEDTFEKLNTLVGTLHHHNGWFTEENVRFSLKSWADALTTENLTNWITNYTIEETKPKTIAIIMAGNIPLVGFHDFLCVLMSGNKALVKLSSNDKLLLPFLANYLIKIEPKFSEYILFTEEKLTDFDAVIATGSNNTARYFNYYFGKYPNIIRKNRNSVAVLNGKETDEEMKLLADDIFTYFGLGCRNVSKIYVPEDYNFQHFFNPMFSWKQIINNNKYINNYDYNKAVYLMSNINLLDNEFMLLKEDEGFSSPISVVFYEKYKDISEIKEKLRAENDNIQCTVSNTGIADEISFGKAQKPSLSDYADGIDTMQFLLKLS